VLHINLVLETFKLLTLLLSPCSALCRSIQVMYRIANVSRGKQLDCIIYHQVLHDTVLDMDNANILPAPSEHCHQPDAQCPNFKRTVSPV
jgi:hypothetical protein